MIFLYILSITSIILSILTLLYIGSKIKYIYVNFYNIDKHINILYSNQDKILELTKIKPFVELVTDEGQNVRKEIEKERVNSGFVAVKKTEKSV